MYLVCVCGTEDADILICWRSREADEEREKAINNIYDWHCNSNMLDNGFGFWPLLTYVLGKTESHRGLKKEHCFHSPESRITDYIKRS